jgi:hypothetical protein
LAQDAASGQYLSLHKFASWQFFASPTMAAHRQFESTFALPLGIGHGPPLLQSFQVNRGWACVVFVPTSKARAIPTNARNINRSEMIGPTLLRERSDGFERN